MKLNFPSKIFSAIVLLLIFNLGCKKKAAITNEESLVKVEKVTLLTAFPGKNRVKLSWKISPDAGITKCRVYWNTELKSVDVAVSSGKTDMEVIVNNLVENNYVFSVSAYNAAGNSSEKVSVSEHSYGDIYESSLKNRTLKSVAINENALTAMISWDSAEPGLVRSEVKYTDAFATEHLVKVLPAAENTTLENFEAGRKFEYRTLYLPDALAIDTFYTAFNEVTVTSQPDDELAYSTLVRLNADGPGNTYQLLGSILGGSPEETPDCRHPEFGPHITEEFDANLNKNVFAFFAHVTPDDDRCGATDRQRTEIKTYGSSPSNVKAFNGDEMLFKWKFKLAAGFKPSSSFTHIHQIKAGDGTNDGSPLITITPRYGSPNKLEIIHTGNTSGSTLGKVKIVELAPFEDTWIEATEKIKFCANGTYELVLKRVSDGAVLLSYSSASMDLWRAEATFIRPKWGIYRSLNDSGRLRDEKVLFADFIIGKK